MSIPILISPSVAALLFGVNERSIRRAIKNREIGVNVNKGRYKIIFSDLVAWSEKLPNRRQKRDALGIGQYVQNWKQ